MVQRAILSRQIVDEATAPARGERWISDTRQKGFGLRIWRSPNGDVRKAYCIRSVDKSGKPVRRTLPHWEAWYAFREQHRWSFSEGSWHEPSLGELIDIARRWAHDELARLKGKATLAEEDEAQRSIGKRRAAALTFSQASEAILASMSAVGLSEAYRDRLFKLFDKHVPRRIKETKACEVTLEDISKTFGSPSLLPGNLRILRPFIGQLLELPRRFGVRTATSSYHFRDIDGLGEHSVASTERLSAWSESDYDAFFRLFESEQDKWQQARCLRLYFHFYCPMSRLMKARWDQLWIVSPKQRSARAGKSIEFLQWHYRDNWNGRETLRGASERIVRECLERGQREFPKSEFWFPTAFDRSVGHIRSIDHLWRAALVHHKLGYISPRAFRTAYREAHPWHAQRGITASLSTRRDRDPDWSWLSAL